MDPSGHGGVDEDPWRYPLARRPVPIWRTSRPRANEGSPHKETDWVSQQRKEFVRSSSPDMFWHRRPVLPWNTACAMQRSHR